MPREKEGYRDNLAILREMFPGQITITIPEAAKAIGMKPETYRADKSWPRVSKGKQEVVSLGDLARRISS